MRHILRRATAPSHEALDRRVGTLDLADRGGYARFLAMHFIGAAALSPYLDAFVTGVLGIDPPDHAAMLAEDLAALDVDAAALPRVAPPRALDPAAVTYVVAGSRLGTAMLRRRPNWGTAHGIAHAYLDDRRGLAVWHALLGWMEAQTPDDGYVDAMAASAEAAFAVFAQAFALSALEAPCR